VSRGTLAYENVYRADKVNSGECNSITAKLLPVASVSSCRTKIPAIFRGVFGMFHDILKFLFIYLFIYLLPYFSRSPLKIFCEGLGCTALQLFCPFCVFSHLFNRVPLIVTSFNLPSQQRKLAGAVVRCRFLQPG
jgi:hypothetical protein